MSLFVLSPVRSRSWLQTQELLPGDGVEPEVQRCSEKDSFMLCHSSKMEMTIGLVIDRGG